MTKIFFISIAICLAVVDVCLAQQNEHEADFSEMPVNFVQAYVQLHKKIEFAKKYQASRNVPNLRNDDQAYEDEFTFLYNMDFAKYARNSLPSFPLNLLANLDVDSKCLNKVLEFFASFQSDDKWGLTGILIYL
jgi:hypothetical protein